MRRSYRINTKQTTVTTEFEKLYNQKFCLFVPLSDLCGLCVAEGALKRNTEPRFGC